MVDSGAQADLFGEMPDQLAQANAQRTRLDDLLAWMREDAPSPMWLEGYLALRAQGVRYRDAMLATWLSLSTDDRGEVRTREDFARLMGVSRAVTYQWQARRPVEQYSEILRLERLRGARLAEVDAATFRAAVSEDGSATDRKLYYQRAQVWEGEEVTLSGNPEAPVQYVDVSAGELEAIREALKCAGENVSGG